MASSLDYMEYAMDQLSRIGQFETKKMMGEYMIYYKGVIIGGVYDNRVLIKKTPTSDIYFARCVEEYPYEGSKTKMYLVDIEDNKIDLDLFEKMIQELPQKKKK